MEIPDSSGSELGRGLGLRLGHELRSAPGVLKLALRHFNAKHIEDLMRRVHTRTAYRVST